MWEKFCYKCKLTKSFSQFGSDKQRKYGLTSACKSCRNPQSKAWRDNNKEYVKEINARSKVKRKAYYDSPERKVKYRYTGIKRRFGLSQKDYEDMLLSQNNVCAICQKNRVSKGKHNMAIDHCHKTGTIRGILCNWCNKGLGLFEDNQDFLNKAIEYLTRKQK